MIYRVKIGCGLPTIAKVYQDHDFIAKTLSIRTRILEKSLHLYEKGYSLQAISTELGVSKSAVRQNLVKGGVELRAHSYAQSKRIAKAKKMSEKTAPYGYCLIQGRRVEEPKEQVILKLILKWSAEGMSHCGIAHRLNDKKLKPRKANKWSQPTIGFIIKRHQKRNNNQKD